MDQSDQTKNRLLPCKLYRSKLACGMAKDDGPDLQIHAAFTGFAFKSTNERR